MISHLRTFLWSSLGLGLGCQTPLSELAETPPIPATDTIPAFPSTPPMIAAEPSSPVDTKLGILTRKNGVEIVEILTVRASATAKRRSCQVPADCPSGQSCTSYNGVSACVDVPSGGVCQTTLDCFGATLCVKPSLDAVGECMPTDACACGKPVATIEAEPTPMRSKPPAWVPPPPPHTKVETVCAVHTVQTFVSPFGPMTAAQAKLVSTSPRSLTCLPADGKSFTYETSRGGNRCNRGNPVTVSGIVRDGQWALTETVSENAREKHNCGRPLFVDGRARVAALGIASDWNRTERLARSAQSDLPTQPESSQSDDGWAGRLRAIGYAEHASIAAFARTITQLCALGAPASILADTARALADEIDHAKGAFALAREFSPAPFPESGPGAFPESLASLGEMDTLHASLLVDIIRGGCVGESLAVLEASELRARAPASARAYFSQVIDEEASHAALAFRTVAWLLSVRPDLADTATTALDEALARSGAAPGASQMLRELGERVVAHASSMSLS